MMGKRKKRKMYKVGTEMTEGTKDHALSPLCTLPVPKVVGGSGAESDFGSANPRGCNRDGKRHVEKEAVPLDRRKRER
ncbi:hypothetical protein O181_044051 [Austropuccinia psidii MF-1]|uniref:Uncharacterized protein n=1 Tax=Austropuccinia psidii MF-1 TaxID=1389203 RepID=A0A9Q3DPN5_9BASI|nr:hypothetical protein [Austropuccinia psidii MF-1]